MKYKILTVLILLIGMMAIGCIGVDDELRISNTLNIYNNATKLEVLEQETISTFEYYEEHLQINDVIYSKKVLFDANSAFLGPLDRKTFTIEFDNNTIIRDKIHGDIIIVPDSIENRLSKETYYGESIEMCLFLNESTSREMIKNKYSIFDDEISLKMIHHVHIMPELTEEDFK